MRIILLLLSSLLFSQFSLASDQDLAEKIERLKELQERVSEECIKGGNSGNYKILVGNDEYTCPQLIVITDRLKRQLDQEIADYKEKCEEENSEEILHDELANETAEIVEKSAECTPSPDSNQCFAKFTCGMLSATAPLKWMMKLAGNIANSPELRKCSEQGNRAQGCLLNVLRGIFDSIWSSLSLIWDGVSWVGNKLGELFGIVKKSEAASSEKAMMAQQAGPGFIKQFTSNPLGTMKQMASNLYQSLEEAAINHYGCEKWSGLPFGSTCLQPMSNWKCGSCQQKAQVYCGIAGYAAGEIGTAFLTGGIFSGGKIALKGAVKVASGPAKNVASFMGKTFPKASSKVSKAAGRVKKLAARGLTASQKKLISGWNAVKNSALSRTIAGLASSFSKSIIGKAASVALKPIGLYLRAMDKAFMKGGDFVESGFKLSAKSAARPGVVEGTKLADEALKVSPEAAVAPKLEEIAKKVKVAEAQRAEKAAKAANASKTPKVTGGIEIKAADNNVVHVKAHTRAKPAPRGTKKTDAPKASASKASKSSQTDNAKVKAADEADELADIAKYRQDPEYMDLFKGPQLYDDHHKELAMVIKAMENSQPAMTKAAIRKKIQETLNSCQL
ncbi:MAG: hypothetical protein ACLGHN_03790 [Bacteriovoracia bacterium]